MKYRRATIQAEDSWSGAGTKTIPIRIRDIISRIIIGVRENTGGNTMSAQMAANITKVELVDGSDVLHSLSGLANQAVCIYDRRVNTMNHAGMIEDSSMYCTLGIDFGRKLWDPELAFDPKQFTNPQLKITYDVNLARTDATALEVEIWAQIFDEKAVSPVGFLMTKEQWDAASPADNTYKYVDLPTDHMMRKLFIRGFEAKYEPWAAIQAARLDEDNDKRVLFDLDLEDYYRVMKGQGLPVIEQLAGYCHPSDSYAKFVTPTDYYVAFEATPYGTNSIISLGTFPKGGYIDVKGSITTYFVGIASGWLPNHVFEFPFGDPADLADWYDVTEVGDLRLRVEGGARGINGAIQVITQQLRRY